jgi:hypothetical protein
VRHALSMRASRTEIRKEWASAESNGKRENTYRLQLKGGHLIEAVKVGGLWLAGNKFVDQQKSANIAWTAKSNDSAVLRRV